MTKCGLHFAHQLCCCGESTLHLWRVIWDLDTIKANMNGDCVEMESQSGGYFHMWGDIWSMHLQEREF